MRWTAPMKAPSPPPTIPSRMRGSAIVSSCSDQTQHAPCLCAVNHAAGEIIERPVGDADALRIDVDEGEVVQLLQDEMRGIVVDRATRMIAGALVEHFEGDAVADVFARMNLIAEIDTGLVIGVQDRTPAASQFVEGDLDQSRRPPRPWIEERPGQRAGEADAAAEA